MFNYRPDNVLQYPIQQTPTPPAPFLGPMSTPTFTLAAPTSQQPLTFQPTIQQQPTNTFNFGICKMDIDTEMDDLSKSMSGLKVFDSNFRGVICDMFKVEPNLAVNLQQTKVYHAFEGVTRFNNKYEQSFRNYVTNFNNNPNNKFTIAYKKENSYDHFYDCVYIIRIISK
jgi:hypothetical protein